MKTLKESINESFERRFMKKYGQIDTQVYEERHSSLAVKLRQVYPQLVIVDDISYDAHNSDVFSKDIDSVLNDVKDVKTIEMLYSFEAMDYKPFNTKNYKSGTISFIFDVKRKQIRKIQGTGNILLSRLLVTDGFIRYFLEYILVDQFPTLHLDISKINYDPEEVKDALFGPLP